MSNLPKSSAASSMVYGIVVGGHDGDPAPDESGGLRVYFPGIHGKDVQVEHLNFSPRIMSPTKSSQQEFPGGLDPGTLVVALKDTGSNYCQIIGIANDTNMSDERLAGNIDLMQFVKQFLNTNINVRTPPSIYETVENGVKVRKVREKGYHNHNVYRGLPTHGAMYNLSGAPLPRVSGIATAKQAYDNLLNGDILGAIPGIFMTLGNMFNLLQSTGLLNNVNKKVPRNVGLAIGSIGNLIQGVETMGGGSFNVGGRVHQQTYLNNASNLLSQAKNVSDVAKALGRLQTDQSLFGLDQLANGIISSALSFGPSQLSVSASGSIMRFLPPETRQAINTAMKAIRLFNSVYPGQNLFGDSAEQIFRMLNRLSPVSLAFAILQLTRLNVGPQALRFNAVNLTTVMGGNPFAFILPDQMVP
jgi:hypothetical protein